MYETEKILLVSVCHIYIVCVCVCVRERCLCMWSESGDSVVKFDSTAAVGDVLQSVKHGLGCALYLYDEHNVCMGNSELIENCRTYVVRRKPLKFVICDLLCKGPN